jgi:hypothetical protein
METINIHWEVGFERIEVTNKSFLRIFTLLYCVELLSDLEGFKI